MIREALVAAVIAIAGCGGSEGSRKGAAPSEPIDGSVEKGRASYYADSLAGNATASGEPYDPNELTAAHRTLPFGALVEVTTAAGRSVRVRVNDRGPFGDARRIVDLSRHAAEELGILKRGVADVTLRVLTLPAKARRH